MNNSTNRWEEVENELAEIAIELTALGDMIPSIFHKDDIEPETPSGIKILLTEMRKRIEKIRRKIGNNFQQCETEKSS